MRRRELVIDASLAGERLDRALAQAAELSRGRARALIDQGQVFVDGKRVKVSSRPVRGGARVILHEPESEEALREAPELRVLYEDPRMVVIDKAPGDHVNETETSSRVSLVEVLRARAPGAAVVHRLDRETSGVMVLAKNRHDADRLSAAFRERRVEKTYWLIAAGNIEDGSIDAPIGVDKRRPRARCVIASGQPSVTEVKTLARAHGLSSIEAHPITGRTHQIRVHLAHRGAPVAGDVLYGGPAVVRLASGEHTVPRVMLHARRLSIDLGGGERLSFEAPLPADFEAFAAAGLWLLPPASS